jgi:diguanylate cyclase (GGDEF)-like protein
MTKLIGNMVGIMERYKFSQGQQLVMEKSRIPYAVYQFFDKRVVTLAISDGFCDFFGFEDREQAYHLMENNMYRDVHPDDKARIADAAFHFTSEGGIYNVVYRSKSKDGGYMIVHANGEQMFTSNGTRLAMVWYTNEGPYVEGQGIDNVTLNKALTHALHEESILKASYYDYLTGLPSMTYFFELAAACRDRFLAENKIPVMLYIDFNGMKFYNSRYGFAEGDKLLRDFAKTLAGLFSNENCSRFGQDHFTVVTYSDNLEERLNELFKESETLNGGRSLPVRVGIYRAGAERVDVSTSCDRAKLACDELEKSHVSCYKYFNAGMLDDANRVNYIIENIDKAIAEKWIKVYYQPIVRAVNGRVCDEEALARWIDPVNGMLSPADFIPALEESGLIYKLEKLSMKKMIGCTIGFAGVVLVNIAGSGFGGGSFFKGDLLIILSTVAYAFSSVLLKKYTKDESPAVLSGYQFVVGGAALAVCGLLMGGRIAHASTAGGASLLYLVFVSAAAYSVWGILMKHNPVSKVAVFGFMTPFFGVVTSLLLLNDAASFGIVHILSLVLVCAGILTVNSSSSKKE